MEAAVRKNIESYAEMPMTRVYSASRAATAEALPKRETPQVSTKVKRHALPASKTRPKIGSKLFAVACVVLAAASVLFVMARYVNITEEYSAVNDLKDDIVAVNQSIAELNVQLNAAISIEDARKAAMDDGMNYPTSAQIVDAGAGDGK